MKTQLLLAILLAGAAQIASAASATSSTTVCTGGAGNTATAVGTGTTGLIQASFNPTCSNNVFLSYMEDTTVVGVCSNSKKGKNNFGGTTNGKAPAVVGTACTGGSGTCTQPTATLAGC